MFGKAKDLINNTQTNAEKSLEKHGLNVDNYTTDQIKQLIADDTRKISRELAGMGLTKFGLALGGRPAEKATLNYLSALVQQNWIIIRQNELMTKYLEQFAPNNQSSI